MKINYEDYSALSQISATDLAYIRHDERLKPFYAYEPLPENIPAAISHRKKFPVDRRLLADALKRQYDEIGLHLPVEESVILNDKTFTVVTAHQPTLLTGPLFHIYKIASIIHLAQEWNKTEAEHRLLPFFVMSGEDHDWEEINHFHLFGKRYEWQRQPGGPCGRLSVEGLEELIRSVAELFQNSKFGAEAGELLYMSLQQAKNYGDFHRRLVANLFGQYGLIVINLDDRQLKKAFIPFFEKELRERFSLPVVSSTQKEIETAGFRIQAHCRQVNMFYMTDELRERIEWENNEFVRIGSGKRYSEEEIIRELHDHPERFSPNVILRPLYQEFILPNIAYIGGGGELAYWLERKKQFELAGIHYPMLIRRSSLMIVDAQIKSQLDKLELEARDMLHHTDAVIRSYLHKHSEAALDFNDELEKIREAYSELAKKAEKIDPTLSKAILAEESKQIKVFEQLGSRLLRTEKHHQETQIKRIQKIREKLFPGGGLQERHDNFLSYYADHGPAWIEQIINVCDPWKEKFILLEQAQ